MIRRFRQAVGDDLATRSARREQNIRDQATELIRFVEAYSTIPITSRRAFETVCTLPSNRMTIAIADLQHGLAELIRPNNEGSSHDDPRG